MEAPDTKFYQKISPQYCFRAKKLTCNELGKSLGSCFYQTPFISSVRAVSPLSKITASEFRSFDKRDLLKNMRNIGMKTGLKSILRNLDDIPWKELYNEEKGKLTERHGERGNVTFIKSY